MILRIALLALSLAACPARAADLVLRDFAEEPGTLVVSTTERRLFLVLEDGQALGWDVAVGKPGSKWFGRTFVTGKRAHPSWRPTEDMRREDPRLPAVVPPGPNNPLGTRAIYLAQGALRIHGTNRPSSIGKAVSHGCFRMRNEDAEDLFERVSAGAAVVVLR